MGNRGILHDSENRVVRPWSHKWWVTCLLEFKGIRRPRPFSQGNYSELFFLDEATAFSAGHRPCATCQRTRHLEFKKAWVKANMPEERPEAVNMKEVDNTLHAERAISRGGKVTYEAPLAELPIGSMFEHENSAYVVATQGYLPWSFEGYGVPHHIGPGTVVKVLTPHSIVRAFVEGFTPSFHCSAVAAASNK